MNLIKQKKKKGTVSWRQRPDIIMHEIRMALQDHNTRLIATKSDDNACKVEE